MPPNNIRNNVPNNNILTLHPEVQNLPKNQKFPLPRKSFLKISPSSFLNKIQCLSFN